VGQQGSLQGGVPLVRTTRLGKICARHKPTQAKA
jgi:hypothetical protein